MRQVSVLAVLLLTAGCTTGAPPDSTPSVATPTSMSQCAWSASWGQAEGAAGTEYRRLILSNSGGAECHIDSVPLVVLVRDNHDVATVTAATDRDLGLPVVVKPTEDIAMVIGTSNPDNFDAADCRKDVADSLTITFDTGETLTVAAGHWPVCTSAVAAPFIHTFEAVTS